MTCIIPENIAKAKKVLAKDKVSFANWHTNKKYNTTEKRLAFLTEQFGTPAEARFFNNKFENYLLKNQKKRLETWVKGIKSGIDTDTKKTLIDKINGLSKVIDTDKISTVADNEYKQFLNGLVEQKLGFGITQKEARELINKNNNIKSTKEALLKKYPKYMTDWAKTEKGQAEFEKALNKELEEYENTGKMGTILQYGKAVVEMKKIYDQAKIKADKATRLKAETKLGKQAKKVKEAGIYLAGLVKSVKASFDISFGRQLSSAIMAHAGGRQGWLSGLKVVGKYFTGKLTEAQRDTLDMMIYVRPNSVNGNYSRLGIAVGIQEEAYPETFVTKGGKYNPFMASEVAFTHAIQMARANIADELIITANGDMGLLKAQKAGEYVNMITGRGQSITRKPEMDRFINAALFSPRWLTSRIQTLFDITKVGYLFADKTGVHGIDRARAWNAVRSFAFLTMFPAIIKGALRAIRDDEEYGKDDWERFASAFDMTTSDFGKIIVGDTRIDPTFGYAALLVTGARILSGTKTSVSGVKRKVSGWDVVGSFLDGKMSPMFRSVIDAYLGTKAAIQGETAKNFMYQPITFENWIKETIPPITLENLYELFTLDTENKWAEIVGFGLDIFGVGANTYGISDAELGKSEELKKAERVLSRGINRQQQGLTPKKGTAIDTKLSGAKRDRAIADYSDLLNKRATALVKSREYKKMTQEEQKEALGKVRESVNKQIKKKYGLK